MFLSNSYDEIMTHLKGQLPRADGYHMVLKIFVPEKFMKQADGTMSSIEIPEAVREDAIYRSMVGLVLHIGPDCYKPEKFKNWTQRQVGDWVVFVPNSGSFIKYDDIPLRYVPEEHILGEAPDPSKFSRD